MLTFREIEQSSLLWFPGLVKCLAPILNLHKLPCRRTITQQTFHVPLRWIVLSVVQHQMEIRHLENARPTISKKHHLQFCMVPRTCSNQRRQNDQVKQIFSLEIRWGTYGFVAVNRKSIIFGQKMQTYQIQVCQHCFFIVSLGNCWRCSEQLL